MIPAPAPAATVLLLRDAPGPGGVEVFMVRRSLASSFMPGAYVFPGGRVEEQDGVPDDALPVDVFRGALPPAAARATLRAAAREVGEEARVALSDLSKLRPWSRWITPEVERKRFDTVFLVAPCPLDARPSHDAVEVTASAWVDPVRALQDDADDAMLFAPPTWYTLWELGQQRSVGAILAEAEHRTLHPIQPRFGMVGEAMAILLPGDPLHPSDHPLPGPTRIVVGASGRWWGVRA